MDKDRIDDTCKWMRRRIVQLAHKAGKNGAHLGGSLSVVEILATLYSIMHNTQDDERDRLILSKGHAALALYSLLQHEGRLTEEDTDRFETNGTHLFAHASRDVARGIEFAGGSLSLGLSYAVGTALACKMRGYTNRIYCIIGDGECDEGLIWESAMSAANYHLTNLTVIVDCNGIQLDGTTNDTMDLGCLADKFRAFGFHTIEVDGHDAEALSSAFATRAEKPVAIIAHTTKGKGFSICEGEAIWHHNVLTDKLYLQACAELQIP